MPCQKTKQHVSLVRELLSLLDAVKRPRTCCADVVDVSVETLKPFWDADRSGGFGGGPKQLGHTATTYASCLTLALLGTTESFESVDRQALYRFFLARKHAASGAFMAHDEGCVTRRDVAVVVARGALPC